jgi:glycosyltransferase involved in cell wall biosynthesis
LDFSPRSFGKAMISVVIPTLNAARLLPQTFRSIFDAAMDGLISEVIVSDCGSTDVTLAIADAAGAAVIEAGRGQQRLAGALAAKKQWLLFLEPGHVIEKGWEEEIRSFIAIGERRAAVFRMRRGGKGIRPMLQDAVALVRFHLSGRLPRGQALLIPVKLLDKAGEFASTPADDEAVLMRQPGLERAFRLKAAVFAGAAHRA